MSLTPAVRQILAGLSADELSRRADADLLARFAANRDEAAFAVLVQRHGPTVLGVCRRTLGHAHDAEDAAQAVFLVLARNVRRVRKPEALSAWLHGVAVRVSRKAFARRRKAEPLPETLPGAESPDPSWADVRRVIDIELAALPESLREPLVLCYLEGLTRDEAATRLGVPLDTFRGRLERGREKLRAALARRGFPLAAGLLAVLLESPANAAPAWVGATTALAVGVVPTPPAIVSLTTGVLPMQFSRYWIAAGVLFSLALGGAVWAAGSAPPPVVADPKPAAPVAAEEPIPLLPKDRTGVWRSVVISDNGNKIERHAIRFISGTELIWDKHRRSPGLDSRDGIRYRYALTATGKLELTAVATLQSDGLEWNPVRMGKLPPVEFIILPLDKVCSSFQLVKETPRGVKIIDAVFRNEVDTAAPDPLLPEYLTKIDRTIKKEPRYDKEPKYVLAAFGPEAKFKVWIVIDGDVAYIDRNGNGDLTEKGERQEVRKLEKNVVRSASLGLTYTLPGDQFTILFPNWFHSDQERTGGFVGLFNGESTTQVAGGHELNYAPSPADAAVLHFGSQIITIRPSLRTSVERQWRLAAPDANGETEVIFEVGTPGIGGGNKEFGAGSFAAFTHTRDRDEPPALPKGVDPVAEYEFTPLDPTDGVKKVTVKLAERLYQTEFAGKIAVPYGVKTGLEAAKVTLSFPECPWGKVEPVTYKVDVIPKKK